MSKASEESFARETTAPRKPYQSWLFPLLLLAFLSIVSAVCISFFRDLRQSARSASCLNDLFYLHEALRSYAAEHDGLLPPVGDIRGNLMIDPIGFYPDHLTNSCWLQCEWSNARRTGGSAHKNDDLGPTAFNTNSFCYLPWVIRNEKEGMAFLEAYKTLDMERRNEEWPVLINGTPHVLPRSRFSPDILDGTIETPPSSDFPIAIEWPGKFHRGGTVLYASGLRVSMKLGEGFPMTEAFITGLREITSMDNSGAVP